GPPPPAARPTRASSPRGQSSGGGELAAPGRLVVRSTVAASVRSVAQSSRPAETESAANTLLPPTATRKEGLDPVLPGIRSFTRTVPTAVPSLFHSSGPVVPSSALKYTSAPSAAPEPPPVPAGPG